MLSVALMGGLSLLISQVDSYKDPLNQEKLVQIMKRIDREIMIRPYDENINSYSAKIRCGEQYDPDLKQNIESALVVNCTASGSYGVDGTEKELYSLDDVDDFKTDKLCEKLTGVYACNDGWLPAIYFYASGNDALSDDLVADYISYYDGFWVKIDVQPYDQNIASKASFTNQDKENQAKEMTVELKSPDLDYSYKFIKANI